MLKSTAEEKVEGDLAQAQSAAAEMSEPREPDSEFKSAFVRMQGNGEAEAPSRWETTGHLKVLTQGT